MGKLKVGYYKDEEERMSFLRHEYRRGCERMPYLWIRISCDELRVEMDSVCSGNLNPELYYLLRRQVVAPRINGSEYPEETIPVLFERS